MSDEPPEFKKASYIYEDKPVFATMVSGGFFIGLVLYFILDRSLRQFPLSFLQYVPEIMAGLILFSSIVRARQVDVKIEINSTTGWVYARSKALEWEGYFFDAEIFQVLQRQINVRENIIVEYKLFLQLHDKTKYEVPLDTPQARQALEILEEMEKLRPKNSGK